MPLTVKSPPQPIVTPEDLPGFSGSQEIAAAVIAAVTAEFDGPFGKLGRCFGPQTIELSYRPDRTIYVRLPCPPIIEIESVIFEDRDGTETTVDGSDYHGIGEGLGWRVSPLRFACGLVRVRYRAGYDGINTGEIPSQIKSAIVLKSGLLLKLSDGAAFVRSDEVEGIGKIEYSVPEQVMSAIDSAADALVAGLKVRRI